MRTTALAALTLVAVLVSACGGGSPSATPASSTGSTPPGADPPTTPAPGGNPPVTPPAPGDNPTPAGDPNPTPTPGGGDPTPNPNPNPNPTEPPDVHSPTAQLVFPPPAAFTQADTVVVRGTAADNRAVSSVKVNGVDATSTDGYHTWSARVPLATGSNTLNIIATDAAGNTHTSYATVLRKVTLLRPQVITLAPLDDKALVVDLANHSILAVDLATGARRIFAHENFPSDGPPLAFLGPMTFDPTRDRFVLYDDGYDRLVSLDRNTGARTVISDSKGTGGGVGFGTPVNIAIDTANNRALISDPLTDYLLAVDLTTGTRTKFSEQTRRSYAVVVDVPRSRALVYESGRRISAVDLVTGARSVLSDEVTPNADVPLTDSVKDFVLDSANNRLLVLTSLAFSPPLPRIIAVHLLTGARSILSSENVPNGDQPFHQPTDITLDTARNRALVTEDITGEVIAVNLTTGERTSLADTVHPTSPNVFNGFNSGIGLDPARNRLLIIDDAFDRLIALNRGDGATSIFTDPTTPSTLNRFRRPRSIAIDTLNDQAFVAADNPINDERATFVVNLVTGERTQMLTRQAPVFDEGPIAVAIDTLHNRLLELEDWTPALLARTLSTYERSVVSSSFGQFGMLFPDSVAVDVPGDRALITGSQGITSVNLSTGAVSRLSDRSTHADVGLVSPRGIAVDSKRNRAIVVDNIYPGLIAVDLTSGARSVFNDSYTPNNRNPLYSPGGITIDQSLDIAYVTDVARVRLIDLVTGERVFY